MTLKLFWKADCPRCPAAKEAISDIEGVEFYNLDESTGLAEAAFYRIMSTPSLVISREDGTEVKSFRGEVPASLELAPWL